MKVTSIMATSTINLNDNAMAALSNVQAAQNAMERLFRGGALDHLVDDAETYGDLRNLVAHLAAAHAALESALIGEDVMVLA